MLSRTAIFMAAAAISIAVSGIAQSAPIAPLPTELATNTGSLTPVYYYRHYHHYYHPHYRHYRHY
jgi:hypothetical protein